jgi:hypothetical protein
MNLTSHTLHQLVVDLHLEETQTLDALLAQMTGDYAASRMLARILYWRDKAIKFGGWVWKSWRDWYAECGLSQGQIKRVHRDGILERFGMSRSLMKANGAPTTHYLLNEDAFVSKLAEFLAMTFDEVKLRLSMIANGETSTLKKKKRSGKKESVYSDYVNDFSDIADFTFPPQTEAQQDATTPQESTTDDADTVIDTPTFDASVLAFAEETNIAPDIIQRMNMDDAQRVWTLIQRDYPKSVKHWREHNDLLAHAFAGVPFADVSEELIHRVQFGQSRGSYSQFYRLTVDKHLTQLRALELRQK